MEEKNAWPINSRNQLTRICEFVYVICRKTEQKTYMCNKEAKKVSRTGQQYYNNVVNFVEAKNTDESCPYNAATYSTDLCEKLLNMYAVKPEGRSLVVYDPFMGSGTTAVACKKMGFDCFGSEISEKQVEWAKDRVATTVMSSSKNYSLW